MQAARASSSSRHRPIVRLSTYRPRPTQHTTLTVFLLFLPFYGDRRHDVKKLKVKKKKRFRPHTVAVALKKKGSPDGD